MIAALDRFAPLVTGELRLAPHSHALRLGAGAATISFYFFQKKMPP
jgi:hypothetical protein